MKLCSKILAIAIIASTTYAMVGCAAPAGFSYQNVGIKLTPYCTDCALGILTSPVQSNLMAVPNGGQGGCVLFTANVTNAAPNLSWTLYPNPNLTQTGIPTSTGTSAITETTPAVGTVADATGNTNYYCTSISTPHYTGNALVQAQQLGIKQGQVMMQVSVPSDPANPAAVATATEFFQIFNTTNSTTGPPTLYLSPNTPSGSNYSVVTLTHGGKGYTFTGYAYGAYPCLTTTVCASEGLANLNDADNGVIWAVGAYNSAGSVVSVVVGGSDTEGKIDANGNYTPPATIPATTTVTGMPVVVMQSHLATSITLNAFINII